MIQKNNLLKQKAHNSSVSDVDEEEKDVVGSLPKRKKTHNYDRQLSGEVSEDDVSNKELSEDDMRKLQDFKKATAKL